MSISSKVRQAIENQSWIRRMFELGLEMKREYGEDKVFDLSLGNPISNRRPEFTCSTRGGGFPP